MFLKFALSAICSLFLYDQGAQPPAAPTAEKEPAPVTSTAAPSAPAAKEPADPKTDPTAEAKMIDVEKQILERTNAQRARYGLPPLVVDRSLLQTARSHAVWMTNNRSLQHTSKNVGENIAMGQRTTDQAVSDWMASPGHRANILNGGYKKTGVAAYQTPDGTIYWCQQFLP